MPTLEIYLHPNSIILKKFFISLSLFFYVLVSIPCIAQDEPSDSDSKVGIVAYWMKGEERFYQIKKARVDTRNGEVTKDTKSQSKIRFYVADSTETSYTIHWSNEKITIPGTQLDPVSYSILKSFENLKLIYKTDEVGTFIELLNWKEVRDQTFAATDKILTTLTQEENHDEQMFHSIIDQLKANLQSQAQVEAYFIQEVQLFHTLMGYEYDVDLPVLYDSELPNIFTGGTIPADGIIEVVEVDTTMGTCTIEDRTTIEDAAFKKMMEDLLESFSKNPDLKQMSDEKRKEAIKEIQAMKVGINITQRSTFDYLFGWPIKIESVKSVETKSAKSSGTRLDKVSIEEIL